MKQISGVDLSALMGELKQLEGARVERIYQRKDEFFIVAKKSGEEKMILAIVLPSALFLSNQKPSMGQPSAFCSKLRSLAERAIIVSLQQVGLERVVKIHLSTKAGDRIFYIELFSKGNLIVCEADHKIILPYRSQTWRDRTLKRGEVYQAPPERASPMNTEQKVWVEAITKEDLKSLAGYLATSCGLGGKYAELLCKESGLDPSAEKVTKAQADKLYKGFSSFIKGIRSEWTSESMQQEWSQEQIEAKKEDKRITKIKSIIAGQEQAIEGLKVSALENQQKGEAIYARYQELNDLLEKARKDLKALDHPLVKKVDKKNKTITVDI